MAHVLVVGLSHHSAPVEVRETIALSPEAYPDALARIAAEREVRECVVLSTCNRSELYAVTESYHGGRDALEKAIFGMEGAPGRVKDEHLFRLQGEAAVRHLFRVASSLDSLVVGEPQVLGQVKDAFRIASEGDAVGPVLDRLFRQAFEVGKRVRSETEIGAYAVSVSYAAVELAKKIFGPLDGRAALIVGAGETGELTLKHLKSSGAGELLVANRTYESAEELATAIGGRALPLDGLEQALSKVDIVVSQTGASEPVIRKPMVERAMKARHGRPLFLIDIAVPRDVEPEAGSVYNVFLYDIDDLGRVVTGNRERRAEAADLALEIVQAETARFTKWFEGLEAVPTIVALRDRFDHVRAQETARVLQKLAHLDERDRKIVEQYGEALMNKVLHGPSAQLRHLGGGDRGVQLASALRYLFRLDEAGPEKTASSSEEAADDDQSAPPRNRT